MSHLPSTIIFENLTKKIFLLNDVLHRKQYGFRENSTTELAINQNVDDLIEAGEKTSMNHFVFLDLAKAFNMVNHKILVSKRKSYNIKGLTLNL